MKVKSDHELDFLYNHLDTVYAVLYSPSTPYLHIPLKARIVNFKNHRAAQLYRIEPVLFYEKIVYVNKIFGSLKFRYKFSAAYEDNVLYKKGYPKTMDELMDRIRARKFAFWVDDFQLFPTKEAMYNAIHEITEFYSIELLRHYYYLVSRNSYKGTKKIVHMNEYMHKIKYLLNTENEDQLKEVELALFGTSKI